MYFDDPVIAKSFDESFAKVVAEIYQSRVNRYVPSKNAHRLRHGGEWVHLTDSVEDRGAMKQYSTTFELKHDQILERRVEVLLNSAGRIAEEMGDQFIRTIYQTLSETCDKSGNVIDAKAEGSLADALVKMFETIEFGVDENGDVVLPEIHVGSAAAENIKNAIEVGGDELKARVEEIKIRKTEEAKNAELIRRSKFLDYGVE